MHPADTGSPSAFEQHSTRTGVGRGSVSVCGDYETTVIRCLGLRCVCVAKIFFVSLLFHVQPQNPPIKKKASSISLSSPSNLLLLMHRTRRKHPIEKADSVCFTGVGLTLGQPAFSAT